jgi:uncharacterized protein YbjT (DUF2867 family)
MKNLLVAGASGVLGRAAVMHFLDRGYNVTAFVRDIGKVDDLRAKGARIIAGDINDPSSFEKIFQGIDIVLTALHAMIGRGKNSSENVDERGHKNFIDAAAKSGVHLFIYTSIIGASSNNSLDFSRTKYVVEKYLEASGMKYTILRPTAFMEWHAYRLLGKSIIDKGKTMILGRGDTVMNFIAVQDIVGTIDYIISSGQCINTIEALAGPDNLTRNQVAEMFGKTTGKPFKIQHLPISVVKLLSKIFHPIHPGVARIMRLTVLSEGRDQSEPAAETVARFGLQPTTMQMFIDKIVE